MHKLDETNSTRSMMKSSFNDSKLDKSNELNDSMSLSKGSQDEYEKTLHNLGGNSNA